MADDTIWQPGWRWCSRCQGLTYQGAGPGVCWDGAPHYGNDSRPYFLATTADPGADVQGGWRWCNRCQGLAWSGYGYGVCWDGQQHDYNGSGLYVVYANVRPNGTQDGWRWCNRCQGLIFSGFGQGICWDGNPHDFTGSGGYSVRYTRNLVGELFPDLAATAEDIRQKIDAKAEKLGGETFTGPRQGGAATGLTSFDIASIRYEKCTIFYHRDVGAFEIHGEIRHKYEYLNLGAVLGMPITDETACADGVGRFNHFTNGSIFWHPDTGPFAVHGAIRDLWQQRGMERGPLGYPICDQFSTPSGSQSCLFQNGGLSQDGGDPAVDAPAANLDSGPLLDFIWRFFDRFVHESPENIGLYPQKSRDRMSSTGGDFLRARNRIMTVTINGFRDNGLLIGDTEWSAQMDLLMHEVDNVVPADIPAEKRAGFMGKNLVVELMPGSPRVVARGGLDQIAAKVQRNLSDGISDAFARPIRLVAPDDERLPTFPRDSEILGIIIRPAGGLSILFSRSFAGGFAAAVAQRRLDELGT
ncbi:LGFP repeat-containing protein [Nocardia colli]|uniref:LGFP repeat-containing protein n=1 Tax=Nocardia colli TaxID=2545717 RepID=UPI0035DA59F3